MVTIIICKLAYFMSIFKQEEEPIKLDEPHLFIHLHVDRTLSHRLKIFQLLPLPRDGGTRCCESEIFSGTPVRTAKRAATGSKKILNSDVLPSSSFSYSHSIVLGGLELMS